MSPPAAEPGQPTRFLYAKSPVTEVKVTIDGLRGPVRFAAEALAREARDASDLIALDRHLRGPAARDLGNVAAAFGDAPPVIEVSAGKREGTVNVAIRAADLPSGHSRLQLAAGWDANLAPEFQAQAEHALPADRQGPAWRLGLATALSPGLVSGLGAVRLGRAARTPSSFSPSLEAGVGVTNFLGLFGPLQYLTFGGLALSDATGRHTLRVQGAGRELVPLPGASKALFKPGLLRTTKVSLGYRFLNDTRLPDPRLGVGAGSLVGASVEVSGLAGDVSVARAEGHWTFSRPFLGGLFAFSTSGGVAVPLGDKGEVPLQERLFLGGLFAPGAGESFPGFAERGIGPSERRSAGTDVAADTRPRKLWRLVQRAGEFLTNIEEGVPAAAPAATPSTAVDRLGGLARATASASFQYPLLTVKGFPVHGVLASTCGTLVGGSQLPSALRDEARASVSAGIVTVLPRGGALGLSWAKPLLSKPGDETRRLQVWFSLGPVI